MRLPVLKGLIRRRALVNFRVDERVMRQFLPSPFRPKLHDGYSIAGICLIRLEQIRPEWAPRFCGISSENKLSALNRCIKKRIRILDRREIANRSSTLECSKLARNAH